MKATKFPREWIVYNLDESRFMYEDELVKIGLQLMPDGLPSFREVPFEFVILWFSGLLDSNGKKLYEDDIVEMYIANDFGSMVKAYAIMKYDIKIGAFRLVTGMTADGHFLDIENVIKVGHAITHPELALEAMKHPWRQPNEAK